LKRGAFEEEKTLNIFAQSLAHIGFYQYICIVGSKETTPLGTDNKPTKIFFIS
jgi:hypothetical protein